MTEVLMEAEQVKTDGPAQSKPDKTESISIVLLFLLAVGCYLNSLLNAFVYDDELQILQNPYIKSWHYLPAIFRTTVWSFIGAAGDTNYYRPLMTLTYLCLWKIFGDSPVGYHLFNILVNALVVTCVYYAGRELFKNQWTALIAAVLFAAHPVHTETVCWVAAVPDLEATLFCSLGFYAYSKDSHINWKRQAVVVTCLLLALMAKEPALMLAPLLVYYEYLVRDDRAETTFAIKAKRCLPVCLAGAGYILVRMALLGKLAPVLQHGQITWPQAIYSAFALVTDYTKLLFWPAHLSAFHVFHVSRGLGERDVLFGIGIVTIAIGLAFLLHKRWPVAAFCIVWTGITLAPVLNPRWMAANVLTERYLYLPSVGFCWLAGWGAKRAWDFLGMKIQSRTALRVALVSAGVVLVLLGTAKTWARNRVWHDDMTLYSATIKTDPDSYVMHMNLGISYFGVDFKSAEKELRRALELKPNSPNILNALGCVYLEQDRLQEAAKAFQDAIASKPNWTDPHFNYGRLLKKTGQNDEALVQFQKAVEVGPLNASAHLYLAEELADKGDDRAAEAQYRQSIQLSPSLSAQRELVDILLRSGKDAEATGMLRQMAKDYRFDSATHLRLARVLEKQGNTEEAKQEYQATLNTDPANTEAQSALKRLDTLPK